MNLLKESTKINQASQSCGAATRTIAPSIPSHDFPGSAAGGPRRGFVPQAQTVKYVSVLERPPQRYSHRLKLAKGINLPLYR